MRVSELESRYGVSAVWMRDGDRDVLAVPLHVVRALAVRLEQELAHVSAKYQDLDDEMAGWVIQIRDLVQERDELRARLGILPDGRLACE